MTNPTQQSIIFNLKRNMNGSKVVCQLQRVDFMIDALDDVLLHQRTMEYEVTEMLFIRFPLALRPCWLPVGSLVRVLAYGLGIPVSLSDYLTVSQHQDQVYLLPVVCLEFSRLHAQADNLLRGDHNPFLARQVVEHKPVIGHAQQIGLIEEQSVGDVPVNFIATVAIDGQLHPRVHLVIGHQPPGPAESFQSQVASLENILAVLPAQLKPILHHILQPPPVDLLVPTAGWLAVVPLRVLEVENAPDYLLQQAASLYLRLPLIELPGLSHVLFPVSMHGTDLILSSPLTGMDKQGLNQLQPNPQNLAQSAQLIHPAFPLVQFTHPDKLRNKKDNMIQFLQRVVKKELLHLFLDLPIVDLLDDVIKGVLLVLDMVGEQVDGSEVAHPADELEQVVY